MKIKRAKKDNKNTCIGCLNIKENNFPFIKEQAAHYIDTEGCGKIDYLTKDRKIWVIGLRIYYCPVCGVKL